MGKRSSNKNRKSVRHTRVIIVGIGEMKHTLFTRAQAAAAVVALDKKNKKTR
jgi:hypothetical protein